MTDQSSPADQLRREVEELRRRVAELEGSQAERRLVEEALKRSEQEKALVLDSVSEMIVFQNQRQEIIWANKAALGLTGVELEQMIGRRCYEFWHGRSEACPGCPVKRALESGEPQTGEINMGPDKVGLTKVSLVRDQEGRVIGVVDVVSDITERKRAEEALKRSEQEKSLILDNSSEVIVFRNREYEVIWANRMAYEIRGLAPEEVIGRRCYDVWHGLDQPCPGCPVDLAFETGQGQSGEIAMYGDRFGLVQTSLVHDEKGEVVGAVEVVLDITERKRAEEALKRSEQEKALVLDSVAEIIIHQNTQHEIIWANEPAADAVGMSVQEMIGRRCYEVFHKRSQPCPNCPVHKAIESGRSYSGEMPTSKGGIGLGRVTLVRDDENKVIGAVEVLLDITERKRAEEAIRAERDMAQLYLDTAEVILLVLDEQGDIVLLNKTGCQILGYEEGELQGRNWYETCLPEEVRSEVRSAISGLFAGQVEAHGYRENQVVTRTGEIRYIRWHNAVVRDEAGRITSILSSGVDITEHKRAERTLARSEERYRRLIEMSPNAILAHCDGRIEYVNPAAVKLFRASGPEDLIGRSYLDLVHPEDRAESARRMTTIIHEGRVAPPRRHRYIALDGQAIEVESTGTAFEQQGRIINQTIAQDISERKRAEEALKESEERFRLTFDQSPICTVMVGFDGRYQRVNPRFARFTGYSEEELASMSVADTTAPEDLAGTLDRIIRLAKGEIFSSQVEKRFRRKDGQIVWGRTLVQIMRDASGRPLCLLSQIEDITERKRAEEEKNKAEARLRQSQKMEAIGTLAGGIAHDFNNVLAAMLGYTELAVADLPGTHPSQGHLNQVLKAGQRAKKLVRQILSFSREGEQERKPVRIGPIVQEALKFLSATLPATIEIRPEIEEASGWVLADPTQIHQLLMNLCSNAAQAMRDKGGRLTVRLERVELDKFLADQFAELAPGAYERLTVSDTGEGMNQAIMLRIFEPFFTTKEPGQGTGMGLAVAHGIVKSHGGAMTVSSRPGQGSVFQVYLPLLGAEPEIHQISEGAPVLTGSERVLFVDDEPALADIGRQTLERLGYKVTTRISSLEALGLFKAQPDKFDLVITDQTMPQMTGSDLAREMLKIRPDLPIVLCTGFSEQISAEQAQAMGIRRFVMKPLIIREVAEVVRAALDEKV